MKPRACLVTLALLLAPLGARAQHPVDVEPWQGGPDDLADVAALLPSPPEGYVTETRGGSEWTFPASATAEVRELQRRLAEAWTTVVDDLGAPVDDQLIVRVGLDARAMHALAPIGHPPPSYAVGVAYPELGVILLSLQAPESWESPEIEKVLVHELSHIALHRAVRGNPLPRWFTEGLAIYQASESSVARIQTLWEAVVAGNIVPLSRLDARFPSAPHRVSVAYAESADLVAWLRDDDLGGKRFHRLIAAIASGMPFEDALEDHYDRSLSTVEADWRASLDERFRTIPLIVSGSGLWFIASILLVMAYVRRRRRHKRKLREWGAAETSEALALDRAERAIEGRLAATDSDEDPSARVVLAIPADPPQSREPGVPTIVHEGRNHTLH